ncbi:hypothetical protein HOY82DRAFT_590042, partial [Tuber indicum]
MTLWHEASNPSDFWPRPATLTDSAGWDIQGFMGRLTEILYQQQNEHPQDPIQEPQEQAAVVMPQGVLQALLSLTPHIKVIEFAQWEIDNGAEAILFSGIPNTLDDECGSAGSRICRVEVTALRRSQKQIFFGRTTPSVKMVDTVFAGTAERFRRQMDTHSPGGDSPRPYLLLSVTANKRIASAEQIAVSINQWWSWTKMASVSSKAWICHNILFICRPLSVLLIFSILDLPPPYFRIL